MIFNITSNFSPFTFDEIAKPFLLYKQEYDKNEQALSTLSQQTEMWKNIAEKDKSPRAYNMYTNYVNKLHDAVDDFSKGMSAQNRNDLLGLQAGYASEIKPIETAYKRRQQLIDTLAPQKLQNPYLMTEFDPENMSIDDFLDDPSKGWGRSLNAALIAAQVSDIFKALSQVDTTDLSGKGNKKQEEAKYKLSQLMPYTYMLTQHNGFNYDEIAKAVARDPKARKEVMNIITKAVDNSGILDWQGMFDKDGNMTEYGKKRYNQVWDIAAQGAWQGIGKDAMQIVKDDFSADIAKMNYKAQLDMEMAAATQQGYNAGLNANEDDVAIQDNEQELKKYNEAIKILHNPRLTPSGNTLITAKELKSGIPINIIDGLPIKVKYFDEKGRLKSPKEIESEIQKNYPSLFNNKNQFKVTGSYSNVAGQGNYTNILSAQAARRELSSVIIKEWTQFKNAIDTLRIPNTKNYDFQTILKGIQSYQRGNRVGTYQIKGTRFDTPDNADFYSKKLKKYFNEGNVKVIKGMSHNKLELGAVDQKDIQEISDAINAQGSGKLTGGDINMYVINTPNNSGLMVKITRDGKTTSYFIDATTNAMGSTGQQAFADYRRARAKNDEIINKKGVSDEAKAVAMQSNKAAGAALMRSLGWEFGGNYGTPAQNLWQQSSTSNQ